MKNPVVFNGIYTKFFMDRLLLRDTARILTGSTSPMDVAEVGESGSIFLKQYASEASPAGLFIKTDTGSSTNWPRLLTIVGGTARIYSGTDDPTSVAKNGYSGSLYLKQLVGSPGLYIKQDDGTTINWSQTVGIDYIASATTPGMVTTSAQTFGGVKTFNKPIISLNSIPSVTGVQDITRWTTMLKTLAARNKNARFAIIPYTHGATATAVGYYGGAYSPTQNRIYFMPYSQSSATTWHYIQETGSMGDLTPNMFGSSIISSTL